MVLVLCLLVLAISSVAIAFQDFRTRLISVWLILIFGLANLIHFLCVYSFFQLLENTLFCLLYFVFSYAVLHLYYFLKTKRFQKVLDEKIGWGDIWLMLLIGCCLSPMEMVYFFSFSFVISILVQLLFLNVNKTIALGGILALCNTLFLGYLAI